MEKAKFKLYKKGVELDSIEKFSKALEWLFFLL